ncbi:unnamed protein product, partial [Protopolystoma xenopodis]
MNMQLENSSSSDIFQTLISTPTETGNTTNSSCSDIDADETGSVQQSSPTTPHPVRCITKGQTVIRLPTTSMHPQPEQEDTNMTFLSQTTVALKASSDSLQTVEPSKFGPKPTVVRSEETSVDSHVASAMPDQAGFTNESSRDTNHSTEAAENRTALLKIKGSLDVGDQALLELVKLIKDKASSEPENATGEESGSRRTQAPDFVTNIVSGKATTTSVTEVGPTSAIAGVVVTVSSNPVPQEASTGLTLTPADAFIGENHTFFTQDPDSLRAALQALEYAYNETGNSSTVSNAMPSTTPKMCSTDNQTTGVPTTCLGNVEVAGAKNDLTQLQNPTLRWTDSSPNPIPPETIVLSGSEGNSSSAALPEYLNASVATTQPMTTEPMTTMSTSVEFRVLKTATNESQSRMVESVLDGQQSGATENEQNINTEQVVETEAVEDSSKLRPSNLSEVFSAQSTGLNDTVVSATVTPDTSEAVASDHPPSMQPDPTASAEADAPTHTSGQTDDSLTMLGDPSAAPSPSDESASNGTISSPSPLSGPEFSSVQVDGQLLITDSAGGSRVQASHRLDEISAPSSPDGQSPVDVSTVGPEPRSSSLTTNHDDGTASSTQDAHFESTSAVANATNSTIPTTLGAYDNNSSATESSSSGVAEATTTQRTKNDPRWASQKPSDSGYTDYSSRLTWGQQQQESQGNQSSSEGEAIETETTRKEDTKLT